MKRWMLVLSLWCVGCLEPRDDQGSADGRDVSRCAVCHGDPDRPGDVLTRAAPPIDLDKNTQSIYPGVGAHQSHLAAGDTHGPVACDECHVVPDSVDAQGHADDALPAEVVFGPLSRTDDRDPSYSYARRRCSDTWCHQDYEPNWTKPKTSAQACGTCHALPPPSPHPQATNCSTCHGRVIAADGTFLHPERHVDGRVEYDAPDCSACHGDSDSAAPPVDVEGHVAISFIGVGAHRVHLLGTGRSRPLECQECHVVPSHVEDPTHADGLPAEVVFSDVAMTQSHDPRWDRATRTCGDTWCHGPGDNGSTLSPQWTSNQGLDCTSCHGAPPEAPHPQMTRCATCHAEVIDESGDISAPNLHVDGTVQVSVPSDCTSCHGGENPAPPRDIAGHTKTTFEGVGAHQTHVLGTPHSRAVPCAECHEVPSQVFQAGHMDTALPAELRFSGVATQYDAATEYRDGTCKNSYCHGSVFFDDRLSGGTNTTPVWTRVDGTQAACGTCHGLPPPLGHPQVLDCQYCHRNVQADNKSFFDPSLHVNGITETYLP